MNRTTPSSLTDDDLHALVDGQVISADHGALVSRLAQDPDAQEKVDQWRRQRDRLRGLHQPILYEPIPSSLLAAARQSADAQEALRQWWRWGGIAAGLLLSFGTGWLTHTEWQSQQSGVTLARTAPVSDFVRQASFAHAVYVPEVRHPVEVAAAEQEHLVKWLSKRLGRPLKVPNLAGMGFDLVGGRLLPGEAGARAQFMFQNSSGARITLYLGAVSANVTAKPGAVDAQETAFRFGNEGAVPSFYWVDQGFGYALAGQLPRDVLMKLAQAVYQQL
jgi:anti-sigma factor RsiW